MKNCHWFLWRCLNKSSSINILSFIYSSKWTSQCISTLPWEIHYHKTVMWVSVCSAKWAIVQLYHGESFYNDVCLILDHQVELDINKSCLTEYMMKVIPETILDIYVIISQPISKCPLMKMMYIEHHHIGIS